MKLRQTFTVLAAGSLLAVAGSANAAFLKILATDGSQTIGDPNLLDPHVVDVNEPPGNNFPWQVPTTAGNWPQNAQGYLRGYLLLVGERDEKSAEVIFEYRGQGNSTLSNSFWLFPNIPVFDENTPLCNTEQGAGNCDPVTGGLRKFVFDVGQLIPFYFLTGNGIVVSNDFFGNQNSNPDNTPHFFLSADNGTVRGGRYVPGFDPEHLAGTYAWASLSDLGGRDSDEQDFVVRIRVPEPGSLALLGVGLLGLAGLRRRVK